MTWFVLHSLPLDDNAAAAAAVDVCYHNCISGVFCCTDVAESEQTVGSSSPGAIR